MIFGDRNIKFFIEGLVREGERESIDEVKWVRYNFRTFLVEQLWWGKMN